MVTILPDTMCAACAATTGSNKSIPRPAPVRQTRPAHPDPGVGETLVLAVQRQVIAELVHQHPSQKTHVHRTARQHVGRRRRRQYPARVASPYDLAHVLQYLVAARLLGQPVRDLLPDDFPLGFRNRLERRGRHPDRLHRHRRVEAQAALVDRPRYGPSPGDGSGSPGSECPGPAGPRYRAPRTASPARYCRTQGASPRWNRTPGA